MSIGSFWIPGDPNRVNLLRQFTLCLASFAALQVVCEGYRWHMLGCYAAIILLFMASLANKKWQRWSTKAVATAGLAGTAVAASLFPVFTLPSPTGPYRVGTVTYDFSAKDANGAERKVVVQLYYPASPAADSRPVPYASKAAVSRFKPELAMVHTHSYFKAPVAPSVEAFPPILFSHSWNGIRTEDTFLIEHLASHGYIVACVDDVLDTPEVVFSDGTVSRHPGQHWLDLSSTEALQRSMPGVQRDLRMRVSDLRFVFDVLLQITSKDPTNMFYHRVDWERAGLLGYSQGGTAVAQVLRSDSRFKVGVNLDGYSFTVADGTPITQPFLTMTGNIPSTQDAAARDPKLRVGWGLDMLDLERMEASMRSGDGYLVILKGAMHPNFSDQPLYSRLRSYTGAGSIAPARAMLIVDAYTLAFFDHYLHHEGANILTASCPPYPEVAMISSQTLRAASSPKADIPERK